MKKLILLVLLAVYSFAVTPFSLENLKEVNVKFLNKKNTISNELAQKITDKVKEKLEEVGIKTNSEKYSHFKMAIKIDKFGKTTFVRTTIMVQEDVQILRDKPFVSMALTYEKSDDFEAEDLEKDIYESFVSYLLEDFIEQYKSEN